MHEITPDLSTQFVSFEEAIDPDDAPLTAPGGGV
jgi:hypothetical protein